MNRSLPQAYLAASAPFVAAYVAVPREWTAPSFSSSWVNFGSGYENAAYRRIGDVVHLRGLVKSGTIGFAIFTLPAGFRPPSELMFAVNSNEAIGRCNVQPDGDVRAEAGSNTWFSLSGISFSVTA